MIQAVSNIGDAKLSFYVGASYGAGELRHGGLWPDPDFLFTYLR